MPKTMLRVLTRELEIERRRSEKLDDENMRLRLQLNAMNDELQMGQCDVVNGLRANDIARSNKHD